jgi:hypothetical protein
LFLIGLLLMLGTLAWLSQQKGTREHHSLQPRGSVAPGNHRMADRPPADADYNFSSVSRSTRD